MRNSLVLLSAIISFAACKSDKKHKSSEDATKATIEQQAIKKIDVHAHYKYERDYLADFFKKWNMQGVLVDVSIADSVGVNRSWKEYLDHVKTEPDLFYLCSSLIGVGIDNPDFAQKSIEKLEQEIRSGARMVKVWKNFGMVTKDASGKFIQIDDSRLQPIWDFLKERKIPVMAHIGEPVQAWRPLDDPNNPHFGYYTDHPEYHAYQHPEIPSYEMIITARDNWIENNPGLKILCAHLGSMSHDVDMVAKRLDKFPNIYVEPAARFGDLVGQDSDKVKAFFEKYQDRILFGTDYGTSSPQTEKTAGELKGEEQNLEESYRRLWTYLSTADSLALRGQKNRGLALSEQVLKKFYYQNTADFLKLN
ncbi:amidohydrolase [Maribacter algarum]|uniref:Amidohydrolase n=1 Tax=Maribacter algarum (ex Zhang et al. 2020) TaxID=2578118 RepID=A0A5S3PP32_9FLAO|nr:amidohydrolase family protein [Maribacter algarum]TMM56238.1 amidohydrolase [Maribacter algarum]